jgi:hypothetical protein
LFVLFIFRSRSVYEDCIATAAVAAARSDSLMKNYYYAIRCFLLDFWQHSLGECAPSASPNLHRGIYQAADSAVMLVAPT